MCVCVCCQCSVPCGVGQRSREVHCVSNIGDIVEDEECNMKLRPSDMENCDAGPCTKSWFFSDWSAQVSHANTAAFLITRVSPRSRVCAVTPVLCGLRHGRADARRSVSQQSHQQSASGGLRVRAAGRGSALQQRALREPHRVVHRPLESGTALRSLML